MAAKRIGRVASGREELGLLVTSSNRKCVVVVTGELMMFAADVAKPFVPTENVVPGWPDR
jgi:hypothetical protein